MNRPALQRLLKARQLRFLVTGSLAVLADYSTFFVSYGVFRSDLAVATVASFVAGFIVSFGLNKLWVFESKGDVIAQSIRQLLLYGALLALNIAFTYYFVAGLETYCDIDPRVSKLIAIGITTAWNYVLYSKIIFSGGRRHVEIR